LGIRDREERRARACRWDYKPVTYRVRVDDTFDQVRYQAAGQDLGVEDVPGFLRFAADYVYRHHPALKPLRQNMRENIREERARRKAEAAERAAFRKRQGIAK
jgi:hypothetical protein